MSTPEQKAVRIFVSHSHADNDFGVKLVQDLCFVLEDDSAVWYDARGGLEGGDNWWPKILEELSTRNVFIVIWSPDATNSKWVNHEVNIAWKQMTTQGKQVIPLLFRSHKMREDLDTLHVIDFQETRSYDEAFLELLRALKVSSNRWTSRQANATHDRQQALLEQVTPQIETAFAAQDWAEVIRKMQFLHKHAPTAISAELYHMHGVALLKTGEVVQAQEALEFALGLTESKLQLPILLDYIELHGTQKHWEEAFRLLKDALKLAPGDLALTIRYQRVLKKLKEPYWNQGNSYNDKRQYAKAISAYTQIITLDPQEIEAYAYRGVSYCKYGEFQQAIPDLTHVLNASADTPYKQMYYYRGVAYAGLQRYSEALADFQRAIELDSLAAGAYAERGRIYIQQGKDALALQEFDHALQLKPNASWIKAEREKVYRKLNSPLKSLIDWFTGETRRQQEEQAAVERLAAEKAQLRITTSARRRRPPDTSSNGQSTAHITRSENEHKTTLVVGVDRKYSNTSNEDSLFAIQNQDFGLFVVADGFGSHGNGQDASRLAIQTISDFLMPKLMKINELQDASLKVLLAKSVGRANKAIYQYNQEKRTDMGTTITATLVVNTMAYVANVGDSRTYLFHKNRELSKITNDHSVAGSLVEAGIIKPDDIYTHPKRNQLYRWLGAKQVIEVDTFTTDFLASEKLLLCSDGLWTMVFDPQIEEIIKRTTRDPQQTANLLVSLALESGGEDNISVIVVSMQESTQPEKTSGLQVIAKPEGMQLAKFS
jgi:serine/threonine protein phosphatase PrpC/Flp pilus assembly protein TadD